MASIASLGVPASPHNDTLAGRAAHLVHDGILRGEFKPATRLGLRDLSSRYDIGLTPLREGLSRLCAMGLVVAEGQRGFRVAAASLDDLRDITHVRSTIEVQALAEAMARGDDAWEGEVLASLHRLSRLADRQAARSQGEDEAFHATHKAFHMTLVGACASDRMRDLCSLFFDQAYRYRRLAFPADRSLPPDFTQEHRGLAEAVLARRTDDACGMLRHHLQLTLHAVAAAQGAAI